MTKDDEIQKIPIIVKYREALDRARNIVHNLEDLGSISWAMMDAERLAQTRKEANQQLMQIRKEANQIVSIVDSIFFDSEK